jgi:hypothetical protein
MPEPPSSSDDLSLDSLRLTDPETGGPLPTADLRDEFARLSRETRTDPDAARAFIESKIDMIHADPTLSEAEKAAAIAEVMNVLRGQP